MVEFRFRARRVTATTLPLRFQIGARTLASIPRRLDRTALSLDDVLANCVPMLPKLDDGVDGYLLTSLPAKLAGSVRRSGTVAFVRQRYTRYSVDLAGGEAAWRAALSAKTRSVIKRKVRKLAEASGGEIDIRHYRTAADLSEFHPLARQVSYTTYQERLLGSGLPNDAEFIAHMYALSGDDAVRAWLLFVGDVPIAYLWCSAQGKALRYDFVGHDPAWSSFSPGTVLMEAALASLFGDRFARFDFTEGEGQHKRGFATDGIPCIDLLLLRPTLANRAAITALAAFDSATALAKRAARSPLLARLAKKVRRA